MLQLNVFPVLEEFWCPDGYVTSAKEFCFKVINERMRFCHAWSRCERDLMESDIWESRLAEPRTAEAAEAGWRLIKSISLTAIAIHHVLHGQ